MTITPGDTRPSELCTCKHTSSTHGAGDYLYSRSCRIPRGPGLAALDWADPALVSAVAGGWARAAPGPAGGTEGPGTAAVGGAAAGARVRAEGPLGAGTGSFCGGSGRSALAPACKTIATWAAGEGRCPVPTPCLPADNPPLRRGRSGDVGTMEGLKRRKQKGREEDEESQKRKEERVKRKEKEKKRIWHLSQGKWP